LISLLGVDEELKAAEAQSVKAEIEANRNFIPWAWTWGALSWTKLRDF